VLSVGLMSGTSMDGIDAALLETDGSAEYLKALGHASMTYAPLFQTLLKATEFTIRKYNGNMENAKLYYLPSIKKYLARELKLTENATSHKITEFVNYLKKPLTLDAIVKHSTELHNTIIQKLLKELGYLSKQIDVIGYHGQTMLHRPKDKISIILGDGQYLAERTQITVVNGFRQRDIQAGGQGAPFAPIYHQALAIRDQKIPLAIINCGGIANITLISSKEESDLIGFDTGPGNCLVDRLVRQRTLGKETMDKNGRYGKEGKINQEILSLLYEKSIMQNRQNYFSICPPKALDVGDILLIQELDSLSLADAAATLEAFTADSIVKSLEWFNHTLPSTFVLSGGGFKNPVITNEFKQRLTAKMNKPLNILTADEAGFSSEAMEAEIFAFFAVRSLRNMPLSVPGTTRVAKPLSGGYAYIPSLGMTDTVKKLIDLNPGVLSPTLI